MAAPPLTNHAHKPQVGPKRQTPYLDLEVIADSRSSDPNTKTDLNWNLCPKLEFQSAGFTPKDETTPQNREPHP